ncbi:unnamed protein product [Tuber aestivum]|uniref:Uncharacterized protein n=1 Tax=Tuber aestivum TaxID=59557 RepID=A0A292PX46_9PEZI|nr:unnamed protein product [Tuber aestivum]
MLRQRCKGTTVSLVNAGRVTHRPLLLASPVARAVSRSFSASEISLQCFGSKSKVRVPHRSIGIGQAGPVRIGIKVQISVLCSGSVKCGLRAHRGMGCTVYYRVICFHFLVCVVLAGLKYLG